MNVTERSVGEIQVRRENGLTRVTAEVSGASVWFESTAVELTPSAEAFGSAFLIPSLHEGMRLRLDQEVDRKWMENIGRLLPTLTKWWDYPALAPLAPLKDETGLSSDSQTALCFSGGVDSFYSLLRGGLNPRLLVFIHGYDIPLEDEGRSETFKRALESVAAATNSRPVWLRTNLRQHPAFVACSWDRTHGGALAAIGHLLAENIDRFIISATLVRSDERPWGSHHLVDHLWSSAHLCVAQYGDDIWRHDKLRAIIDEPLVREHLRVCWENRRPAGNCSHCDKCIMTMVVLAQAGKLDRFPVFEIDDHPAASRGLVARIDQLPRTIYVRTYAMLLSDGFDRKMAGAVRRLLARSLPPSSHRLRRLFPARWRTR
jgi:hypothetical protein